MRSFDNIRPILPTANTPDAVGCRLEAVGPHDDERLQAKQAEHFGFPAGVTGGLPEGFGGSLGVGH